MEALIASGVTERERISRYRAELERICGEVLGGSQGPLDAVGKAQTLFARLWKRKPSRYKRRGPYRLHEVIEAERSPEDRPVGNCLGLTLLFNVLLRRMGIDAKAVYLEQAFNGAPHVLTLLPMKTYGIDVENILPEGFDYKGHLQNPTRTIWGDRELVADIHHSIGNDLFEKGFFDEALKHYDRAIELNPHYEKARLNRIMARAEKRGK